MNVTVVYASQTGTAKYYAQQCVKTLWQYGVNPILVDIQDVTLSWLHNQRGVVLFVVATSGQGQMTESAVPFWRALLASDLPDKQYLQSLQYSILGLGDRSYEHFNYAAKKLHRRLEQLGGQLVVDRIFADEQSAHGIDDGYDVWMRSVLLYFQCERVCRDGHMYTMTTSVADYGDDPENGHGSGNGTVCGNHPMTPIDYEKDVRLVSIHFDDPISIRPGDIAIYYPHSQDLDVRAICRRLGFDPQARYRLSPNRPDAVVNSIYDGGGGGGVRIYDLLRCHLDIYSPFTRSALLLLSQYCGDDDDGESGQKLQDLATKDYDLYLTYIVRPKRTPMEVLTDFHSITGVPVEALFDLFPTIRPRSFSIASLPNDHDGGCCVDLCVSLVRYQSPFLDKSMALREGLASRSLSRLTVGDRVKCVVKAGDISAVDYDRCDRMVLIGAGTGIAPLRAVIQHCHRVGKPVDLFYGCRHVHSDCLFGQEWREYDGTVTSFYCLGSRDGDDQHVRQHLDVLLLQHADIILSRLLEERCVFVVSGNVHLPKLIKSTIDRIAGRTGFADHLHRTGRLVMECWP